MFHGGLFELKFLEILQQLFFVKNHYLSLIFFQVLQSALLKSEKKNILNKDANHLKIA